MASARRIRKQPSGCSGPKSLYLQTTEISGSLPTLSHHLPAVAFHNTTFWEQPLPHASTNRRTKPPHGPCGKGTTAIATQLRSLCPRINAGRNRDSRIGRTVISRRRIRLRGRRTPVACIQKGEHHCYQYISYAFHRLSVFMFLIILLQPRGNDAATHHDADRPNKGP